MKPVLRIISFAGLALMFSSAVLVFTGSMPDERYHVLALVGTVMWFAPVPFWMKRRLHHSE